MSNKDQSYGELVLITPELAKKWIAQTGDQNYRTPIQSRVNTLVDDIRSGRWRVNGETIVLSHDGVVQDGMHRLTAVVQSGISIRSYVIFNVDTDVSMTIDRGRGRNLYQDMHHYGVKKAGAISRITHAWAELKDNLWGGQRTPVYSSDVLWQFYLANRISIDDGHQIWNKQFVPSMTPKSFLRESVFVPIICEGTCVSFSTPLESEDVMSYARMLASGIPDHDRESNSAILQLRNQIIRGSRVNSKLEIVPLRALAIFAWNLHVARRTVKVLTYKSKTQEFPVILHTIR